MTNKTECPHCLTVYIITDEQYQKSNGTVRCGNCRQTFVVSLFNSEPSRAKAKPVATPFAKPAPESIEEKISQVKIVSTKDDLMQSSDPEATIASRFDSNLDAHNSAENLIDAVDALIEEKLVDADESWFEEDQTDDSDSTVVLREPFILDPKPKRSFLQRWIITPILCLLTPALLVALIYQLWLMQALPILDNEQVAERAAPWLEPARKFLDEQFDWQIPERRDLAAMRLVSARLEPHPSRASTILLKITLLNQSKIAQPFPWLELELLDVDGRRVSRRALSPLDYLHNNRVENLIGANELRPVTIELLAFPEQAHGFELKIIDR